MKKIFLFACLLLLGLGLWVDNSLLVPNNGRKIASTSDEAGESGSAARLRDLSKLEGPEFLKAFKYALIESAHALMDENDVRFSFGNFLVAAPQGQKIFVCNRYPYMELTFVADGMAFSGEAPRILVRGLCETGTESIFIEPLRIPYRDILALPLSQKEFTPNPDGQRITIEFRNVVDQWPRQWNLVGLRLYDDRGQSLFMDGYEIISILGQPLSMEWED